jgi:sigma-B regulation protein RsbU (phosphoserine phosphatase)
MKPEVKTELRSSLLEKRQNLSEWLQEPDEKRQVQLGSADEISVQTELAVIDTAMQKDVDGTLGICAICHEAVDAELLHMDYTRTVCLGHFSPDELSQLEMELELAQTVQRSLLPQEVPHTPLLETAAFTRPAQIVSGDYFDFFQFAAGAHGLAIGDVAGHGVSSSLHMASLQALLRTLAPASQDPSEVVAHVNRLLIHNVGFATFASLFLASFDPISRTLTYCNAGHNPPLVLRSADGDGAFWLNPTGAAIGLVETVAFQAQTVKLQPGDVLLLYTDGVPEAMNAQEEMFGYERLAHALRLWGGAPAMDIIRGIRQELERFTQSASQSDDVTLVVCRIVG